MSTVMNDLVKSKENFFAELDFKFIYLKLYGYRYFILIMIMLSLIVGCLYVLRLMPKYVSTALIQVDTQLGVANNMQQLLGNMGISPEKASPAEIEMALIKSRFILQSVVDSLDLNIVVSPNYLPLIGSMIAKHDNPSDILAAPLFGLAKYAWGGEKIEVKTFTTDNKYIDIPFILRADENNAYTLFDKKGNTIIKGKVDQLIEADKNSPWSGIKIRITSLSAHPGTTFTIVRKNRDDVVLDIAQNLTIIDLGEKNKAKTGLLQLSYQGSNRVILDKVLNTIIHLAIQKNIEKKLAEASNTLTFLNKQLPEIKSGLEQAETNLNEYRARSGTLDIAHESKIILTQLSTLEQSIADLRLKKVELLQEMTNDHPFIVAISHKERQLQKEADKLAKKIRALPQSDQQAISLERTVKVKNQLFVLLLNSIQQLEVLKASTLSDIRILSLATTPVIPLPSHSSFIIFTSMLMGLLLSIILIFIRELFQNKITHHEQVEDSVGLPTFAIVPYCSQQKTINNKIKQGYYHLQYCVLANLAPKNITTEAFRSLRTMLQFHFETANNNIICLLGATPGIGKSFTSVNLAHVLIELGNKVLLVDADMRKGQIHLQMGKPKSPGFAELLSGKSTGNSQWKILETLYFIPCGEYPNNPSALLTGDRANKVIEELSEKFDYVIFDTPPILAVTDGVLLARHAATNLFVVGAGTNVIEEIELAANRAAKNGVKIHGLVFNHLKSMKHTRINYYYAMQE